MVGGLVVGVFVVGGVVVGVFVVSGVPSEEDDESDVGALEVEAGGVGEVMLGLGGSTIVYMTCTPTRLDGRLLFLVPENTTLACEDDVIIGSSGMSNLQSLCITLASSSIPS